VAEADLYLLCRPAGNGDQCRPIHHEPSSYRVHRFWDPLSAFNNPYRHCRSLECLQYGCRLQRPGGGHGSYNTVHNGLFRIYFPQPKCHDPGLLHGQRSDCISIFQLVSSKGLSWRHPDLLPGCSGGMRCYIRGYGEDGDHSLPALRPGLRNAGGGRIRQGSIRQGKSGRKPGKALCPAISPHPPGYCGAEKT